METDPFQHTYIEFQQNTPMDLLYGFNTLIPEISRLTRRIFHEAQPIESLRGFKAFAENLDPFKWEIIGILPDKKGIVGNLYDFAVERRLEGDPRYMIRLGQQYVLYLANTGKTDLCKEASHSLGIFNNCLYFVGYVKTLFDTISRGQVQVQILNESFTENWDSPEAIELNSHLLNLRSISLSVVDFLTDQIVDGGVERLILELETVRRHYYYGTDIPKESLWGPSLN